MGQRPASCSRVLVTDTALDSTRHSYQVDLTFCNRRFWRSPLSPSLVSKCNGLYNGGTPSFWSPRRIRKYKWGSSYWASGLLSTSGSEKWRCPGEGNLEPGRLRAGGAGETKASGDSWAREDFGARPLSREESLLCSCPCSERWTPSSVFRVCIAHSGLSMAGFFLVISVQGCVPGGVGGLRKSDWGHGNWQVCRSSRHLGST